MRQVFIALIVTFLPGFTVAQYFFSVLQTKDGLSSKSVTSLVQDSDGFLWLGTQNGLNRFDGSSIKIYNWAHHNYPLELDEGIRDMVEIEGGLLLGTRNGIVRFVSDTKEFLPVACASMSNQYPLVYQMLNDTEQRTWITCAEGLYVYQHDTLFRASHVFPLLRELDDACKVYSRMVLDKRTSGIWCGTEHGLCLINYDTGEYFNYFRNPAGLPVFRDSPSWAMTIQRSTGDLWWGDRRHKLSRYRVQDSTVHIDCYSTELCDNSLTLLMYVDAQDRLWYSTWDGEIFVIEPSGKVIKFPDQTISPYKLHSGFTDDIIEDTYGNLWFATMGGAAMLSASNVIRDVIDVPNSEVVTSMCRLDDGRLLITSGGLNFYDESTRTFERHVQLVNSYNISFYGAVPVDGMWWCGTRAGIMIFNPVTRKFNAPDISPYTQEIRNAAVTSILRDKKGCIWFTTYNNYIYKHDPIERTSIRFDGSVPGHGDIGKTNCLALKEDSRGRIWAGNGEYGMRVYSDPIGFVKIVHDTRMEKVVVTGFAETAEQQMWVSTWGEGLYEVDVNGAIVGHLTTQHGLSSNYTSGVSVDHRGNIWFGTPEAVHYFQPGVLPVSKINFDLESSLGDNGMNLMMEEDRVYVSMLGRILIIDQKSMDHDRKPDLPLISAVYVLENEVSWSSECTDLKLRYDQNFFRIDFSSPRHHEFSSLRYAYILEGFNPDWVNADRRGSAGYTNVPPGNYVFRVKASDPRGQFHDEDRHFSITITPPFWQTTWFYILCGAIVVFLLYLSWRLFQKRSERRRSDQVIDYFANSVYSEHSVKEICWDIARNCISQLGFQDCIVFLMNEERSHVVQVAAFGPKYPKGSDNLNPLRIPVGQGIIGTVAAQGRPLLVPDTSKDPRYIADDMVRLSEISVPIMHDQKVIGIIDSEHPDKNFFTPEHLKTLSTIASISAYKIADAQAEMQARESELKLMEVNKLFAESQLKALRAQMNPHFVFNCLNSIQECIVTRKYSEASAYLSKFAKLFRHVLNNSGKLLITIDEEIEILKLYLELEQMRFEQSFEYKVHVDADLESEDILMPSMFLQPFVENALWHGLMHKNGDRLLTIAVRKIDDEIFACEVSDNGIGRAKAAELKQKRIHDRRYESKGMQMNLERLKVLKKQGFHASMDIIDQYSASGEAAGTTVRIELSNNLTYH